MISKATASSPLMLITIRTQHLSFHASSETGASSFQQNLRLHSESGMGDRAFNSRRRVRDFSELPLESNEKIVYKIQTLALVASVHRIASHYPCLIPGRK